MENNLEDRNKVRIKSISEDDITKVLMRIDKGRKELKYYRTKLRLQLLAFIPGVILSFVFFEYFPFNLFFHIPWIILGVFYEVSHKTNYNST